jgi:class 3 adenylate cyclase
MFDIDHWLNQIGLAQYADLLRSNEIDSHLLRGLNNDDLKEMGISALGHRKKLLEAIAALGIAPETGAPAPAAAALTAISSPAERRQLTVMFCDLVGATAPSRRLDPEDLRQLVASYHEAVAAALGPYEDHIAQYLGDGVLAYFGYPRAHEDDAARAMRAALSLRKALQSQPARGEIELQIRIGVATGLVVVGEIGSGTTAAEYSASGETPNLAARLQAQAQPGEIVLSDDTRNLLGEAFRLGGKRSASRLWARSS